MALLSSIAYINPDSITKAYPHKEIEYIDISSVHTGNFDGTKTIQLANAPSRAKRIVKDGDTILATVRPNLRAFLYVKNPANNTIVSTGFAVLRAKQNKLDSRYLYYSVTNQYFTDYLTLNAKGSAYPAVDTGIIGRAEVNAPAIEIQQKISGVLGAYDDLIENNSKRIEKLEALARLLYRHNFDVSKSDDWEEAILDKYLIIHRGKSYKSSELSDTSGLPFINLKCIKEQGGFRQDGLKWFKGTYKEGQKVSMGDIVMAVTEMTYRRAIIARVGRVPSLPSEFGIISMDLIKLEPKNGTNREWLYSMFRWSQFGNEVKEFANGVNVLHLIPARVTEYKIKVPPKELQEEFGKIVVQIFDLIDNLQRKNELLTKARDLLLPRLMSGEIEV